MRSRTTPTSTCDFAGTRDFVSMLEAGAHEITEEDMLAVDPVRPGGHRRLL